MNKTLKNLLQLKNSFLIVLLVIQGLILSLAVLLTRMALANIDRNEAEKRVAIQTFVTGAIDHGTSAVEPTVTTLAANETYMRLFAEGDRAGLFAQTKPLFDHLARQNDIKQMQFTSSDFKVFLRVHNPRVFGDDVTSSRPTLVECITARHSVAGLEQGLSGYGFRAVTPAFSNGKFLGCVELGLDLSEGFLKSLDANYPGRWAMVNLDKGTALTRDQTVLATLNEPANSDVLSKDFSTADDVRHDLLNLKPHFQYLKSTEEVALEIPVRNFRGNVALYVRCVSPTPYYATVRRMVLNAAIISVLGMALTGFAFSLLYKGIRTPVQQLVLETEKIKNFDLKDKVEIRASLVELDKLIRAISDMKIGLQSFQKYVPADLVRQLIETRQEARIGGKLRELTVFFSDIADFTTITENLPPNELTHQLSEYFDEVTKIILAHRGTVDKYIGDAVMAFWGAPYDLADHALLACRAALRCQREIAALSVRWRSEGRYEFHTRIGLSTGEIVVGNIGSEQRLNYSVIGDSVNLASRLESLNKQYKTSIIISEDTYQSCSAMIEARLIDFVVVKGKLEPVRIYELIGERGDISPRQKQSLILFSRAIDAYLSSDFNRALELLNELHEREPKDAVASLYLERCRQYLVTPPEADWRGVFRHTTK